MYSTQGLNFNAQDPAGPSVGSLQTISHSDDLKNKEYWLLNMDVTGALMITKTKQYNTSSHLAGFDYLQAHFIAAQNSGTQESK